ncbi:MAG: hypothetical protein ICV85_09615 [Tolypothrix sp. T3-bin4]|nr:hypothetical protein [Tolypothrix sp. T3-bin4]
MKIAIGKNNRKLNLISRLALATISAAIALVPKSAQASTFSGFGCIDKSNCQSYLGVYGGGYGISLNNQIDFQNFPIVRSTSPILWDSSIPDGPRGGISKPYSNIFEDSNGKTFGRLDGFASARIETVLRYGQLKALALASAESEHSGEEQIAHYFMDSRAWAGTRIEWGDTIQVKASNKQQGELVPFEVRLDLDRNLTASGRDGGNTQAFVTAGFVNLGIFDSNYYPSNVVSLKDVIYLPVGEITPITAFLEVGTSSRATATSSKTLDIDYSMADASHTADYYLTPLDSDVSYITGSGQTYVYKQDVTPLPDSQKVPEPSFILGFIGLGAMARLGRSKKTSP